ncbi:hypothetical protein TNCV_4635191, partial [Trichonephila clavipes]
QDWKKTVLLKLGEKSDEAPSLKERFDAGCHWEMEREAFLHPISRLLMGPDVGGSAWSLLVDRTWQEGVVTGTELFFYTVSAGMF